MTKKVKNKGVQKKAIKRESLIKHFDYGYLDRIHTGFQVIRDLVCEQLVQQIRIESLIKDSAIIRINISDSKAHLFQVIDGDTGILDYETKITKQQSHLLISSGIPFQS